MGRKKIQKMYLDKIKKVKTEVEKIDIAKHLPTLVDLQFISTTSDQNTCLNFEYFDILEKIEFNDELVCSTNRKKLNKDIELKLIARLIIHIC